jgi:hypothetical protein
MRDCFNRVTGEKVTSVLLRIPLGTLFFEGERFPTPDEYNLLVTANGNIGISDPVRGEFTITLKPGKGRLLLSGGLTYPKTVENVEVALQHPETDWVGQSREYWHDFSSHRLDFASMIPVNHPLRDTLLDAIDSVSILIKCQQSSSGGVMAGHIYPMAYVRDMSGVMHGLLALGYHTEARAILDFWINKYNLLGKVSCSDGMGNDDAHMLLTNDEVEVPAYIVQDCFLYYKYTRDENFLKWAFPMMEWRSRCSWTISWTA